MADYNLGTAEGEIRVRYDGRGINDANDGLNSLHKSARNVQQSFNSVATTTGVAASVMAAGIGLAVNSAIDFEKQISAIGAVSNATESQLESLRAKALQLGAQTAFSASEAALAMEELAKAGLSVDEIMNGAADATVALAAAGQVSLPNAAAIASNAMNQFNLAATDLAHVADLIAGAANASAIDVNDFGLAMAQSGAVANLVGLNFDDLAVAIALMGNAGIKGSDAGTSLKTMLQNLQPSTKKQIELMTDLGILTEDGTNRFYDQQGSLKSLSDIAGILNASMAGMTDAQKAMTLETIFGTDAIRAAAILSNAGAEGFDAMAASMGEVTAEAVAAKRLDNVAGSIEQLKGSVETAAIAFGTALLPAIRKITEFITELVNRFTALDPRWQKFIAFAAVAVAAVLGFVAVLAGVVAAIAGVVAAFASIGGVVGIIAGVIAAIVAVGAAIAIAYHESQRFRDLIGQLGQVFQAVFGVIMAVVGPVIAFFRDQFLPAVERIGEKLMQNLAPAFAAVGDFIQNRVMPGMEKLKAAFDVFMPVLTTVAGWLLKLAEIVINILGKALGFIIPLLLDIAGPIFSLLISVVAFIIKLIPQMVEQFLAFIQSIIETKNTVVNAFTAIKDWIVARVRDIAEALVTFVNKVREHFQNAKQAASDKLNELITFVASIPGRIVSALGNLASLLYNSGKALLQGFWDGMKATFNSVLGWAEGAMSKLRGLWPFSPAEYGPFSGRGWVLYSGRALMEGFAKGMDQRVGMVDNAARRALAGVAGNLPTDFSATVRGSQAGAGSLAAFGGPTNAPAGDTTTTHHTEVNITVPLEDLRSITDVQDLLDFIDRLRNDSRRGLGVGVA